MIWGRATWAVQPRSPRSPTSPTRITISPSFWSLHRVVTAPKLPMPLSQSLVERGETETLPPRQPVGDWAGMSRSKLLSQQQARRGGLIVVDRPTQQICISDIYYIHIMSTDKHKIHRKVICWVDSCCNEYCLHLNKCKLQPCQGQVRIAKEATVTQQIHSSSAEETDRNQAIRHTQSGMLLSVFQIVFSANTEYIIKKILCMASSSS